MKRILVLLVLLVFVFNIMLPVMASEAEEEAGEEQKPETIDIWVWTEDIPQGTRVAKDSLKQITVKNENIPANVMTDAEGVVHSYAKRNLYAGEYVSADQISENSVKKINYDILKQPIGKSNSDYLIVTDYVEPNTGDDLAGFLQELIDKNPNRTIYFPDGVYTIASTLLTSAAAKNSVSIMLSDGAVIKASSKWSNRDGNALISLGGAEHRNDIKTVGHYYIVAGGTLDGSGVTGGIIIESGRETVIKNICIKNTVKGIVIEEGANSKSADCDFEDITIIGNGMPGTIGLENKAYDNTYTNIRIYDMATGFKNTMGGEIANIYVTFTERSNNNKQAKVGIYNKGGRISNCVTENCDTGFEFYGDVIAFDCTAVWTSNTYKKQNAFYSAKKILFSGCKAYFCEGDGVKTSFTSGTESVLEGCTY